MHGDSSVRKTLSSTAHLWIGPVTKKEEATFVRQDQHFKVLSLAERFNKILLKLQAELEADSGAPVSDRNVWHKVQNKGLC